MSAEPMAAGSLPCMARASCSPRVGGVGVGVASGVADEVVVGVSVVESGSGVGAAGTSSGVVVGATSLTAT